MSADIPFDERTVLAVTSILRSKKRALQFLKVSRGVPEDKLLDMAREYRRELKAHKAKEAELAKLEDDPDERREILFILRNLMLMGLPHKPVHEEEIKRTIRTSATSRMIVTLKATGIKDGIILPYGILARRVLAILCTLVVQNKNNPSKEVITLDSAAEFMRRVGWRTDSKGGLGGKDYAGLARVLEQLESMRIEVKYEGFFKGRRQAENLSIVRKYDLPSIAEDRALEHGEQPLEDLEPQVTTRVFRVQMDPLFVRELVGDESTGYRGSAFPLPLQFITAFSRSTEIDVAQFLAARVSAAKSLSRIDIHDLQQQLGFHLGNYSRFKDEFRQTTAKVKELWSGCNAEIDGDFLVVGPVLNGNYLVDPTKFEVLPDDLFGAGPDALTSKVINNSLNWKKKEDA
jgi:hypothetical protein